MSLLALSQGVGRAKDPEELVRILNQNEAALEDTGARQYFFIISDLPKWANAAEVEGPRGHKEVAFEGMGYFVVRVCCDYQYSWHALKKDTPVPIARLAGLKSKEDKEGT